MKSNRRTFLKGLGGALALPMLESIASPNATPPMRFLVVGNPFGAHPKHFFPETFGSQVQLPSTLQSLKGLQDRLTIVSHTDHGMVSGHGREISFLSGVLPADAQSYPEKNMSLDQLFARHTGSQVRYPSISAALDAGIRMSWTANGVENHPFTDPLKLYDHLFRNLSSGEKRVRRDLLRRNDSILDLASTQISDILKQASKADQERMDQFQTSVRELEQVFTNRDQWLDRDKPAFDISGWNQQSSHTIRDSYDAIFDMIGYAFETDLTRVASVAFPSSLRYTEIEGVHRSYHGCTHNGKREDVTSELVAIESFQISRLARCLEKLDSIQEPNSNGTLLDNTIVLFGSGMGYGGTHSNRNLPILVAGGGFKHLGHVDAKRNDGTNMPLCNLYVTLMQRFGIERDRFNTSDGTFDLPHA